MINDEQNQWGVQRVPDQEVMTGGAVAKQAGAGAASGAAAGSAFGPWGTVIGGVVGGAAGFASGKIKQGKQQKLADKADRYNQGVEDLNAYQTQTQTMVPMVARDGLKMYNDGVAEIEGSGTEKNGEVVLDKNYNIIKDASGAPTHDEGGTQVAMKDGYTVMPWQKSEKKYQQGMRMVKKYKMNGDAKAKAWLDKEKAKLPTDEDYGYDTKGEYSKGLRSYDEGVVKKYEDGYREVSDHDEDWDYRLNEETGEVQVKRKGETEWRAQDASWNQKNTNEPGSMTNMETTRQSVFGDWVSPNAPSTNATADNSNWMDEMAKQSADYDYGPKDEGGFTPAQDTSVPATGGGDVPEGEDSTSGGAGTEDNNWGKYAGAAMGAANMFNNAVQGAQPAETVERRYLQPEDMKYRDSSALARKGAMQGERAQNLAMRGKGLSAGQQNAYARAANTQLGAAQERINEFEAGQKFSVDQFNVGQRNQAQASNVDLANQYDVMDAQNRAAKQAYADTAYYDASQIGQNLSQAENQKSVDNKKMAAEKEWVKKYVGTKDYNIGDEGTQYRGSANTNTYANGRKPSKKPSEKQLKPGSYKMLPDGTIIMK